MKYAAKVSHNLGYPSTYILRDHMTKSFPDKKCFTIDNARRGNHSCSYCRLWYGGETRKIVLNGQNQT